MATMATQSEPEIILYDLACTKNVCFSPVVWRIRLMLNYKRVPYKTIFLEFPDIEPTLRELGLVPAESAGGKYTVPAIFHALTKTYIMDSTPIAEFLESNYPDPPVPLSSELGNEISSKARNVVGGTFRNSVMPHEINVLSPRSQEYFRCTREATIGHPLEDLLDPETEEKNWKTVDPGIREIDEMMRKNKDEGPFILGAKPCYADFFIAGSLQSARTVEESVFQRLMEYPGHKQIYEACQPYMEKNT